MSEISILDDDIFLDGIKVGNLLPNILPSLKEKARQKIDGADAEREWFDKVDELEDDLRYTEEEKEDLERDISDLEDELEELKNKYNKILDAIDHINTFTIIPDPDLLKQLKETHEKTAQILLENGK